MLCHVGVRFSYMTKLTNLDSQCTRIVKLSVDHKGYIWNKKHVTKVC